MRLVFFFACLVFSSCIEFEREKITYIHDEEKDELRLTLVYEGIFGNHKEGGSFEKGPDDQAIENNLNQIQTKQMESLLEQNRAFFFSNWIFEYNPSTLPNTLGEIIKDNQKSRFGKPEQELIDALLQNIEVKNIGFFKNKNGKLCGAQTMRISNLSKVIPLINLVIRRQMLTHLSELQEEVTNQTKGAYTQGTVDLIAQKLKDEYSFIHIDGNLISYQIIMNLIDQENFIKGGNWDNELPKGACFENHDDYLLLKIGEMSGDFVTLEKKCFDGYVPNALQYVEKKHAEHMLAPRMVQNRLKKFFKVTR